MEFDLFAMIELSYEEVSKTDDAIRGLFARGGIENEQMIRDIHAGMVKVFIDLCKDSRPKLAVAEVEKLDKMQARAQEIYHAVIG